AWPAPVWGRAAARPYSPEALVERVRVLREGLGESTPLIRPFGAPSPRARGEGGLRPHRADLWPTFSPRAGRRDGHQVRGSVTPRWPWYLPPRSLYEVSQTSSGAAWKNSICATPSLA